MHVSLVGPRIYGEITAAQKFVVAVYALPALRNKAITREDGHGQAGPRAPMRYTGFSLVESPGWYGWQRSPAGNGFFGFLVFFFFGFVFF